MMICMCKAYYTYTVRSTFKGASTCPTWLAGPKGLVMPSDLASLNSLLLSEAATAAALSSPVTSDVCAAMVDQLLPAVKATCLATSNRDRLALYQESSLSREGDMLSVRASHVLFTKVATCRGLEPRRFRCFPGLRPSRQGPQS
jgi:hypothetical protein